jgi:hypothetical protein
MRKNNQEKVSNKEKVIFMMVYLIVLSVVIFLKSCFSISFSTGILSLISLMMLAILKKTK